MKERVPILQERRPTVQEQLFRNTVQKAVLLRGMLCVPAGEHVQDAKCAGNICFAHTPGYCATSVSQGL